MFACPAQGVSGDLCFDQSFCVATAGDVCFNLLFCMEVAGGLFFDLIFCGGVNGDLVLVVFLPIPAMRAETDFALWASSQCSAIWGPVRSATSQDEAPRHVLFAHQGA